MKEKIAKFITYISHPLLMLIYGLAILLNLNSYIAQMISFQGKIYIIAIATIAGVIFPLSFFFFLLKNNVIKTITMETKEERIIPFMMTGVFYYFIFYLFREINLPPLFTMYILFCTLLVAITVLINIWWKISVHMMAAGSIVGLLAGTSLTLNINLIFYISLFVFFSGWIGFARLQLKAHNKAQIYIGFLLGLAYMVILFIVI